MNLLSKLSSSAKAKTIEPIVINYRDQLIGLRRIMYTQMNVYQ